MTTTCTGCGYPRPCTCQPQPGNTTGNPCRECGWRFGDHRLDCSHHPRADAVLPVHYRDDGYAAGDKQRGLCPHSGTGNMAHGCPNGCEGAREHYANDGHPRCAS